jgi:Flp pilus assembly protein TadG
VHVRLASARRRGTILPLLALTITLLMAFVALAIDVGVLTIARTEAQNACDAGALAGARVLNNRPGHVDNDRTDAAKVAENTVLRNINVYIQTEKRYTVAENMTFTDGSQAITVGQYNYNAGLQRFEPSFPATNGGVSWTALRVKLRGENATFFAKVVGVNTMPWEASAVAAHRPRDVAIVLDYSGSMQFGSQFNWEGDWGGSTGSVYGTMNPDPVYPKFGHNWRYTDPTRYSDTTGLTSGNAGAATGRPNPFRSQNSFVMASGEVQAPANLTVETSSGPPMILDFRMSPDNANNPTTPAATVNANNLWNAFNRWMRATPAVENVFTDPAFRPGGANTGTNTGVYVDRTFSWTGYDAFDRTNQFGPTPAPDSYAEQSDADAVYVGDRSPRKGGQVFTAATSWNPATATGAARDVRDVLSAATATNSTLIPLAARTTAPTVAPGGYTFPTFGDGGNGWNNFRDDVWERYGYDLDVSRYSGTSPAVPNRTQAQLRTSSTVGGFDMGKFQGYSMGPAYYGKTFFQWPPDPRFDANANVTLPATTVSGAFDTSGRAMCDWRRRFFYLAGTPEATAATTATGRFDPQGDNDATAGGTQSINQALLNNGTGRTLNVNTGRYRVNYRAVLAWLKNGPQTLPPNLRAGRMLYYTSIPDDCDDLSNLDKRFWRNYIDFVLGYNGNSGAYVPTTSLAGTEPFGFPEGITPAVQATGTFTPGGTTTANPRPYMNYTDNPSRPRLHFWFGPYTMLAFLSTREGVSGGGRNFWLAGTVHEAQCWQLKAAMNSALDDIKNNHPNDFCSLVYFSNYIFQTPRVRMGQDWEGLKLSLFYPNFNPDVSSAHSSFITALKGGNTTTEMRPYNSTLGNRLVGNLPNANGGTDPVSGMAMAFNTLSWSTSAYNARSPNGAVNGGTGRRGAAKIVIFETDGVPNGRPQWTYTGSGFNTYYAEGGSNPGSSAADDAVQVVNRMRQNAGSGGFSLPSAPCRVFAIGFGDLFAISPPTTSATDARTFLLNVQKAGGTSAATDTALPPGHIITGPYQTRIDNLKSTLERIMQSGVQVTLIQ